MACGRGEGSVMTTAAAFTLMNRGPDYKVLRGGSFGTDPVACRGTFRNWDHPIRRQIFAGFRLARDLQDGR